jgi:hypothetical protein
MQDLPVRRLYVTSQFLQAASLALLVGILGCASAPTDPRQIAKRRVERASTYQALTPEQRSLVDRGQVQVGMPEDAVFIAWGKPAQVLRRGDATGEETTWLYSRSTTDQFVNWNYIEVRGRDGNRYLDRVVTTEYAFQDYVSARLTFRGGVLTQWETLPSPGSRTFISPGGPILP